MAAHLHRQAVIFHLVLFVAALCSSTAKGESGKPITLPDDVDKHPILKSIYAGQHQLDDFFDEDTEAVVFFFTSQFCPVAQQYVPRLNELHEKYQPRGIQLIAVYSNSRVNLMGMAKHAHDSDIYFPAMLDHEHRLADLLGAKITPEAIVVDRNMMKRYQGPVDNQFTKRGRMPAPSKHYLINALDSILEGHPVERPYVLASGCQMERQPRRLPDREITYHRDVAPIIQNKCESCHRDGNVGPFPLSSYEDVYYSANTIAEVVEERRMPPWHAHINPKFGKLKHDPRLSEKEISTLLAWVKAGTPEGDPQDAPAAIDWPDPNQWAIGQPDFVYEMTEPFTIPKTGIVDYQFFRVKLGFPEDRWLSAIEVKPGNREVVHHIALHLVPAGDKDYSGLAGMIDLYGIDNAQTRFIGDYVPGDPYRAKVYPSHQAMRIPKGLDLIYELHYTPNNREETTDQSIAAFRWAEAPPTEEVYSRVFRKPLGRFQVPPREHHFKMQDSYYFEEDVVLDAIRAHFHLRGKSYRLEVVRRDEATGKITECETLLTIPVWDLDWQRTYELETPLALEAGTELRGTAIFDNSHWNPNNPDPDATVSWGQQTNDEMFNSRFVVRLKRDAKMADKNETQQR